MSRIVGMGLLDWLKSPPPLDPATVAWVDHAVAAVDPLLKTVPDYARRLAPGVEQALAYCADIAARIPGPFEISRAAFSSDPLVHALFGSADDIETMLAGSQCVRDHLVSIHTSLGGQCCALLGMRHREKAGYGARLAGGMVRFDEPQKALYFTDHTVAEPNPDVAAARAHLRDVMFDGLVKSFAVHVAEVRAEHEGLHQEAAMASAQLRARARANALAPDGPESHTRRLTELQERLRATGDALQPERLIGTLSDCLAHPEPYLRLDPVTVSVDRAGIITGKGPCKPGECDTLHFAELTSRDQRRWVVMLAMIEREEARRAVERLDEARRYIVI